MHSSCIQIALTQFAVIVLKALALIKAQAMLGCLAKAHVQYSHGGFSLRICAFASHDSELAHISLAMIFMQICSGTRHDVLGVVYYICPSSTKVVKSCCQEHCWKVEHAMFYKLSQIVLLIHRQLVARNIC